MERGKVEILFYSLLPVQPLEAGLSCVAEQLGILRRIKEHVGAKETPEIKDALSRLRKQVEESRKIVQQVNCLRAVEKSE